MAKIYFVLGSTDGQRCFKRIKEFKNAGFEVKVFGFERGLGIPIADKEECQIIGSFPNSLPYVRRLKLMYNSLHRLYKSYKTDKSIIWYYFGEVIAIPSVFINSNNKFIYEESDISSIKLLFFDIIEILQRYVIKRSILTVFTSDGFIERHFISKDNAPCNIIVKPNKVNRKILDIPEICKKEINIEHIKFGFVGCIRFDTIFNIANYIGENYPMHEFHFYGVFGSSVIEEKFRILNKHENIHFHGLFKNPEDLPQIYANIDILVSTYGSVTPSVRFAEPNKLYESMYFKTPIVVSSGTSLGFKVEKMGIGYAIDANDIKEVDNLINNIGYTIESKFKALYKLEKEDALENSKNLMNKLNEILETLN